MRLDEPAWWYAGGTGAVAACLQPLGALYGFAAESLYRRAKPYRSALPVVCIGNFTAGGTGKTPLAMHVCRMLEAAGHQPVVLTRGYGGRLTGPYWVDAKTDPAAQVGDEALLLARTAPTNLSRDRAAGARAIENGPHPVTVIVMDDGLQNGTLAKDLSIAVVDGWRGLGNGRVMPAGPLRAPLDFQLELTDAIVVNDATGRGASGVSDWLRHRFNGPVLRAQTVPAGDVGWLEGARVVAWAGIGAPERFFAMLVGCGADVAERAVFRDHQRLQLADAERLLALAGRHGATLVTTEKDMARLSGATGLLSLLASSSRAVPIEMRFAAAEAERLSALFASALKARQG